MSHNSCFIRYTVYHIHFFIFENAVSPSPSKNTDKTKPIISGIKPYSVSRWMKSINNGGINDVGQQKRPYHKSLRVPRNQEIQKYINDKVRFEIAVLKCKGLFLD